MSAIAGLIYTNGRPVSTDELDRMIAAAPPRSTDGVNRWNAGPAGGIRFSYATTKEAARESQPFIGPSGAVAFVDGRIDDREALLSLLKRDDIPRDAPDGMLVLAVYEQLGREFVRHLVGDYAIAIWEPGHHRMSLFRSPLGWRPMFWTFDGTRFAFATDARTLVLGLGLDRSLNEGALAEFLAGRFVTETDSFWKAIQRVPQGGAVFLENGQTNIWPWHGGPIDDWQNRSMEEHVEQFKYLFDQALISATRSNGQVTSQLSGGLDSSSIVCRATELHRAGVIDQQIRFISARFPGQPHDETPWSSSVERHIGLDAEIASSVAFSPERARAWCADTYQLPVRPNALDTMASSAAVLKADGRRVLLTGEGGDDWMNGSGAHWPDLLLRGRWPTLLANGMQYWPNAPWPVAAAKTFVTAARPVVSPRHRRAMIQPHLDWRLPMPDWLRPEWMRKVNLEDRWHDQLPRQGLNSFAQRSRYAVFTHGNRQLIAESALTYAESCGIEVRHPFHDARITKFMLGASGVHLSKPGLRKVVLREAMRGTLPEMVRTRTTKTVFVNHSIDTHEALFAERPAADLLPVQLGWMEPGPIAAIQADFAKWRRDGSTGPMPDQPMGPVWFALATDMWLRHAVGL